MVAERAVSESRVSKALITLGQAVGGTTMSGLFLDLADKDSIAAIGRSGAVGLSSVLRMSGEEIRGVSVQVVAAGYGASLVVVDNYRSQEGVSPDLLNHDRVIAGAVTGIFDTDRRHLKDEEIEAGDFSRLAFMAGIRGYRGAITSGRNYDINTEVTVRARRLLGEEFGDHMIFEVK